MVEKQLTNEMIQEGKVLLQALDETELAPDVAIWFYFSDIHDWKLILTARKLKSSGPRDVYRLIQKTLRALKEKVTHISLDDVALAKPDAPMIRLLSLAIGTGAGISGIRFTQNTINGVTIEDAYIYRLVHQPKARRKA